MTYYYFDSSAWVKRYADEPVSLRVDSLFAEEHPRVCSVLGRIEVTSTIARKLKANDFTRVELDSRMDLLDHDWRGFIPVELTRRTLEAACGTALRFALRGADSIHLAALLALHNRVAPAGHRVVLVASDRELLEAAQTSGIETLDPAA